VTGRRRCVIDASVLLDFSVGDIFEYLFAPPFDHRTSDFVADEVSESYGLDQLRRLGLTIFGLDETEISEIATIQAENPRLSISDISLFILVRRDGGFLLTGDRLLNQYSSSHAITCHGTLWVLDELVQGGSLNPADAGEALMRMRRANRRLPRQECDTLLSRWGGGAILILKIALSIGFSAIADVSCMIQCDGQTAPSTTRYRKVSRPPRVETTRRRHRGSH